MVILLVVAPLILLVGCLVMSVCHFVGALRARRQGPEVRALAKRRWSMTSAGVYLLVALGKGLGVR